MWPEQYQPSGFRLGGSQSGSALGQGANSSPGRDLRRNKEALTVREREKDRWETKRNKSKDQDTRNRKRTACQTSSVVFIFCFSQLSKLLLLLQETD